MPLILDTHETNTWIAHTFEDARKGIVIISPFLRINGRLRRTIELAGANGVPTFVVYGKRDLDRGTYDWLRGLRNASIGVIANLHAKLYMNEWTAVITSMNLYEYSQVNNEELGVLIQRRIDKDAFKDVTYQALRLMEMCRKEHGRWDVGDLDRPIRDLLGRGKDFRSAIMEDARRPRGDGEPVVVRRPSTTVTVRRICHCIRCGRAIPSEHPYVYCGRCMESWMAYRNLTYVEGEGRCYICGRYNRSSAVMPACPGCYRTDGDLVDLKRAAMRDAASGRRSADRDRDRPGVRARPVGHGLRERDVAPEHRDADHPAGALHLALHVRGQRDAGPVPGQRPLVPGRGEQVGRQGRAVDAEHGPGRARHGTAVRGLQLGDPAPGLFELGGQAPALGPGPLEVGLQRLPLRSDLAGRLGDLGPQGLQLLPEPRHLALVGGCAGELLDPVPEPAVLLLQGPVRILELAVLLACPLQGAVEPLDLPQLGV